MKVNNFNSKINLPKFCQKLGYTDYQFIRIPTFGWYAYNKDRSFIGNVFDLVPPGEQDLLYSTIAKDNPEYLEFDISYSELADDKLRANRLELQLWTAAYAMARKEMDNYRAVYEGRKVYLKNILEAHGLNGILKNRIGVITGDLLARFPMLPWPKKDLRGKLLVPSFCTPSHICSLEYTSWNNLGEFYPLYLNDEKGWYGNIKKNYILNDIKELSTTAGITWDAKADYWTTGEQVTLSDFLSVDNCLRIWTESKHTLFTKSPLTQIVESGKVGELKNYVGKLNFHQLEEIESATGEKLAEYWKQARDLQVTIGDRTFAKRDNCYYVYKRGVLQQVTNFAVDIEKIVKKGKHFFRIGTLHYGNQSIPFELHEKYFASNYMFPRGIKDKFLQAGLGIPIIHPDFTNRALLIIDSFNSGVKIEIGEEEAELTTSSPSQNGISSSS